MWKCLRVLDRCFFWLADVYQAGMHISRDEHRTVSKLPQLGEEGAKDMEKAHSINASVVHGGQEQMIYASTARHDIIVACLVFYRSHQGSLNDEETKGH